MGSRLMAEWLANPLLDPESIGQRLDAVEELVAEPALAADLREMLRRVYDVERLLARVTTGRATPRDLSFLGKTLRALPALKAKLTARIRRLLGRLEAEIDLCPDLRAKLEAALVEECPLSARDGGLLRDGFHAELDALRELAHGGKQWIARYQAEESERTGIPSLKVGFNKVFGYYLEVTNAHEARVPDYYIRKQTVKNAERYITEQLKHYENEVLTAEDKALESEQRLFEDLRQEAAKYISRLQQLADTIAQCDCLSSLAHLAARRNYCRPKVTADSRLMIREGKHPVLAEMLGAEFVPNDVELGDGLGQIVVITGPNMSGKSTYIRQTALLVLMAQAGSFIPAKESEIGLVDRIFTRVGASDELVRGQSTFMVEMTETANIINNATARSLVILDEVGRGTSTYDGLALAWAITEHIATGLKCRTLFATHYHELTELAELFGNIRNCNVAVREWMDEVVFLHRILPGGTDKSYGIHVAKLAGLPKSILARSNEILEELESVFAKEATGERLAKHKTREPDGDALFVQKHKSVLDKLASTDVNNLTPLEPINLLSQIKREIAAE